ncbi:MAG: LysE family translocator [Desulfohalobiaceae bacterium]|nr:LysE family translocator [Desulfohalobiaceae bacterium]
MLSTPLTQILSGATLGLFAGLAPGPMLTLVLAQTIQYNAREGIKVAAAPLITDPPIIALALVLFDQVADIQPAMGIISLAGAVYLGYLGLEALRVTAADLDIRTRMPNSFQKGILTNFLNPHPYLFWFSVGIPLLLSPEQNRAGLAAVFLISFYLLLVGSKMGLALVVGRGKPLLKTRVYPWIMKGLGIALWVFGLVFLVKGVRVLFYPV